LFTADYKPRAAAVNSACVRTRDRGFAACPGDDRGFAAYS
jgi:hypothetical protein